MTLLALLLVPMAGTGPTKAEAPSPVPARKPVLISHHPSITHLHRVAMRWRSQYGKGKLKLDEKCCRMAQRWANHLAATNTFYHGNNDQIIAYGTQNSEDTCQMWMNSPPHAGWMLSDSKICGWGFQRADDGTPYWVGVFR